MSKGVAAAVDACTNATLSVKKVARSV